MRTGILLDELDVSFADLIAQARTAADLGYRSIWLAQRGSWDALTALAAIGAAVPGVELGTSVVPTYPRHPITLAAQARTLQAATGSPVNLGVGVSHRHVVEGEFGYSFDRPIRHLREYLQALDPVLRGEKADFHGETITAVGGAEIPNAEPPSVVVGAVSPASLRVSGAHADGATTVWAGPRSLAEFVVPTLTGAAAGAGRPAPRVISAQLICVTNDPGARLDWIQDRYGAATGVPAYRAILDRDGYAGIPDAVLAGDEEHVLARVRELEDAGATELLVMPFGEPSEQDRTRELFARL
ncbi:TIGR03564 family F420-dependent LLM class oxidoreductase [Amycolatopsis sp. NPDC059021]|uniref:TIGR03564 family F420-dependent LLM class oxidoreductase n=1 Tax=Amycolatopsis sp. NPDC059021 TaxID=3346704 RepID=UPI00366E3ACE